MPMPAPISSTLRLGADPGVEATVRALDEHPRARAAASASRCGAVADVGRGDPQVPAVRGGRQGVGVGPGPAGPVDEPPLEELAGGRPQRGHPGPADDDRGHAGRLGVHGDDPQRRAQRTHQRAAPTRKTSTVAAQTAYRLHQKTVEAVEARNSWPVHSWCGRASPAPR